MLNFLENHDEQRFASEFFGKDKFRTFAPLKVSLMLNTAVVGMIEGIVTVADSDNETNRPNESEEVQ